MRPVTMIHELTPASARHAIAHSRILERMIATLFAQGCLLCAIGPALAVFVLYSRGPAFGDTLIAYMVLAVLTKMEFDVLPAQWKLAKDFFDIRRSRRYWEQWLAGHEIVNEPHPTDPPCP